MDKVTEGCSEPLVSPSQNPSIERIQDLLRAKDDTSKFVGLALLKAFLDNDALKNSSSTVQSLFESISPKFLDRLLRARSSQKLDKLEATSMVDLAVSVFHTFSLLIPEELYKSERVNGRILPLVKALVDSSTVTSKLILQTLLTLVSQVDGAIELLRVEDLSPLTEIAPEDSRALDVLSFALSNASIMPHEGRLAGQRGDALISNLAIVFKGTDAVTLLEFVAQIMRQLDPETLARDPRWLSPVVDLLRKLVLKRPTLAGRTAYTSLTATLLQHYPTSAPTLLFATGAKTSDSERSFCDLFITLILTDIQASLPTLLSKLNDSDYSAISDRLACAFDVLSGFIGFLIRSLDDESDTPITMSPDVILKLRKNIAETVSLAIEFLRERWDASVAGVAGLDPSVRAGAAKTSTGSHLTLTWESKQDNIYSDPLMLAAIRILAIWVREDENEHLRNEASGLMDMFVELHAHSSGNRLDFRYPILLALEGIMSIEDGATLFLKNDGWDTLVADLIETMRMPSTTRSSSDISRGMQTVRILLAIIDHASTTSPPEAWMSILTTIASLKVPLTSSPPDRVELHIAMLQLSAALLDKAGSGMRKRYAAVCKALAGLARQIRDTLAEMDDRNEAGVLEGLLDELNFDLGS